MDLDIIKEDGSVESRFRTETGVVYKPAIGVDGDVFLFTDDIEIVKQKIAVLKSLYCYSLDGESRIKCLKIIPIYSKLSSEDCKFVIDILLNYTGTGMEEEFSNVFETDNLYSWVANKKKLIRKK